MARGGTGTIQSPFYPVQYPSETHCLWVLKTDPRNHFKFTIGNMVLINGDENCTEDALMVSDDDDDTKIWRLCKILYSVSDSRREQALCPDPEEDLFNWALS